MLLPVSHEDSTVERLPWVSISIMAACLLGFLVTWVGERRQIQQTRDSFAAAIEYFAERPYLELDARLLPPEDIASLELPAETPGPMAPLEQRELDARVAGWLAATARNPLWSLGLIPAARRASAYATHLFLHAGWMHLLGNLLCLYLTGPFVENRWGRGRFAALYAVGGLVSGLVYAAQFPQLYRPLVGASGAISAVMAAFLVEFFRTRIVFLFMPLFPLPPYIPWRLPAFFVLPVWFGMQIMGAAGAARGEGGGVAYHAHLGGFVAGLVIALAVKLVRRGTTRSRSEGGRLGALLDADVAAQSGNYAKAWTLASHEWQKDLSDAKTGLFLWQLSRKMGDPGMGAPVLAALLKQALRSGDGVAALGHWRELRGACPRYDLDLSLVVQLLETLERSGARRELEGRLPQAVANLPEIPAHGPLVRLLRLARRLEAEAEVVQLIARLRRHPETTPDLLAEFGPGAAAARAFGKPL